VSCLHDPRFENMPVTAADLPELEVEVTVLSPLRPADSPTDFDPSTDGILLEINQRVGCFLPQVARETGWDRQQLLSRLCTEKLGLPADAWRQTESRLQKFGALIIGPEPLVPPAPQA
ncbi:MAG: AMMECR1 family protein, partial [Phycisphaerae bacterium]|nr:AMMECR1 family protein [Phycisphaerae bacterium]